VISKASQRGGARQLATHLLNRYDNERVEVADLRGSAAQDLPGAFLEWYAQSLATKCQKYLYSLSISPDVSKYQLTREQYFDFIARTERSLKLVGQPRAVVFHFKNGREHAHVVWSRIDVDAGKAVHIAYDRMKRRRVAQEFARDHGLPLPETMQKNGHKDRFNNKAKQSNLAEKQQEERSGEPKEVRRAKILQAWKENPDAHGFVKAMEQSGYRLARGDSRDYVVVDLAGEVHSLTRQLSGNVKAGEVKALLKAEYPPDKLPDIEAARARQREALKEKAAQVAAKDQPQQNEPSEKARIDQEITARRAALGRMQENRRSRVAQKRTDLEKRFDTERDALNELHRSEDRGILSARAFSQPKGLRAFLMRVTGFQMIVSARRRREDTVRAASQEKQKEALKSRHGRERQDFDRQYRNLAALEKRERHSFETALKREEFQRIARPERSRPAPPRQPVVLKPEFDRVVTPETLRAIGDSLAAAKGRATKDFADTASPEKAIRPAVTVKPEFDRVAGLPGNKQVDSDGKVIAKKRVLRDFAEAASLVKDPDKPDGDTGARTPDAGTARPTPPFNGAAAGGGKEDLSQTFKRALERTNPEAVARARRLKEQFDRRQAEIDRDRRDRDLDHER